MIKNIKNFNIVITGVGGQGLITLTKIIAETAMIEGYDIKTSELHGLSQKGGSVQTHIRFGEKIYSPLVSDTTADLIIGLEISEALRNINFSNSKTNVLVNEFQLFYIGSLKAEEIVKKLNSLFKERLYLIPASEICEEKFKKEVLSGIYLFSLAINKKLIPLNFSSGLKAISNIVPEKYLEVNKQAFKLGQKNNE
ncbi:MAG: indolepyruvate oxidoreductase subunit beta [Candidatus Nealsonbacteria bacterium]